MKVRRPAMADAKGSHRSRSSSQLLLCSDSAAASLYTIATRCFIVVVLTTLYFKTRDPLFLVLDAIVLIGLLPSIYVAAQSAAASKKV